MLKLGYEINWAKDQPNRICYVMLYCYRILLWLQLMRWLHFYDRHCDECRTVSCVSVFKPASVQESHVPGHFAHLNIMYLSETSISNHFRFWQTWICSPITSVSAGNISPWWPAKWITIKPTNHLIKRPGDSHGNSTNRLLCYTVI